MRKIPYGAANFEDIRIKNAIYVDKTMYIEKLEEDIDREKTIYLRPRRFGKSLFTSMLTYYYSVDTADKFEKLFKGLYIYDHPTQNKNNYYVLNLNFSGMTISEGNIIEEGKDQFYKKVRIAIESFINRYNLNIENEGSTAAEVLENLIVKFKKLNLPHKLYIIIDEYDNFTNAILKGNGQDFLDLVQKNGYVKSFYEVIKQKFEEGVVGRFFATGVMPVTLDNLTSGFNIATNLSTDAEFTSMIGFTHEEVKEIVKELVPAEDAEKVHKDLEANYDGYRFSKKSEEKTFNSTLVLYYLKEYIRDHNAPEQILDVNMNTSGDKIRRTVELVNREINYPIVKKLVFENEVEGSLKSVVLDNNYSTDDLITMLFHLGYLTIKEPGVKTLFRIPNHITENIYSEYMLNWLKEQENYKIETKEIEEGIKELSKTGSIQKVVNIVQEFLKYCSTRDKENFSEKMLKHTFAMFLSLSNQFIVYGEYPAGQGFADIFIEKTSVSYSKYEAVIELKYMSKEKAKEENKEKLLSQGKEQLARYLEDKRLLQRENLKKYVVMFIGFEEAIVEEV
ncbi:MAG: AAA family ATPase [Clostridia bacterium]|nr:AAA family ATPase [Clostridia bacterium]